MEIQQTNPGNWEIIIYNPKTRTTSIIASGFQTYNEAEAALASHWSH